MISNDFVAAMKALPAGEHEVVAVAARSLDSAKKFAAKHKIKKAYGAYVELSRDPEIGNATITKSLHNVLVLLSFLPSFLH